MSAPTLSCVPGIDWPGLPTAAGAAMLAMQWQYEQSQWWTRDVLTARQFDQLRLLLGHAVANVPHYRDALRDAGLRGVADLSPETFARWPLLRKGDVMAREKHLHAAGIPQEHGRVVTGATSGSTGEPVRLAYSEAAQFFIHALILRSHLWHGLDLSAKFAAISSILESGTQSMWSPVAGAVFRTGPASGLNSSTDVDRQLDWLIEERPAYLQTRPTNLRALLGRSRENGKVPPGLRAVILDSESLPPGLHEMAQDLWNAKVLATYCCAEFGTLALQCPQHQHYHVQSESVYLEVLREDATPCAPGEVGQVVVTTLHNFAMPLVRYVLGDYAEVGRPCACGRGLPVLNRIVGRMRNMAVDPDGRRFWPSYPAQVWLEVAPVRRVQLVQHTPAAIEILYVMERNLDPDEQRRLRANLQSVLGYPFDLTFTRVEGMERRPGDKFEDFVSRVPPGDGHRR